MEWEMIFALGGLSAAFVFSLHLSARLRGDRVYLRELHFRDKPMTPQPGRVSTPTPVPPAPRPFK